MTFEFTIPEHFEETCKCTPVCVNLPYDVCFNGKPFAAEAPLGACYYPRAMDYLITMANGAAGQSIYESVDRDEEKKHTLWLSISRNAQTEIFFEVFKKAGLYMSKLTCGYTFETDTLVLSGKLCRELSRATPSVHANILTYIRTLLHMANWFVGRGLAISLHRADAIEFGTSDVDALSALYPIKAGTTFKVTDKCSEELETAVYHDTVASSVRTEYTYASQVRVAALSSKNSAVATWDVASNRYYAYITEHDIYTNHILYLTDLSTDSVITQLASMYNSTVSVHTVDMSAICRGESVFEIDPVTVDEVAPWVASWVMQMVGKGSTFLEERDYAILQPIGVICETTIPVLDRDTMLKQYENDAYAQELYKQYKPHYDDFELKKLEPNLVGFAVGDIYSMVFVGESGTGKSTAARVIPHRCGIPYVSVNFSVNIEEADLFGAMCPNPCKKSADDPEFVWQDGIITKAVRNGYCVILEELNFARPGVLGKLNSLLDENRQIDLTNGEIVRAHPNFRMIATCNIAYEGTNRFNKALINRFDDITEFVDMARPEAIETIMKRTKYKNRSKINKVYEVYEAIKKFAKEQCITCVVSMRQLLNIFTKGKYYENAYDAVLRIMLNGAFLEDAEYLEMFKETILPAFDLKFQI